MPNLILFALALIVASSQSHGASTEAFSAANAAFLDGEFETAYAGYQELLDDGHINTDLLYNLGNASYRLGRPGEAALWYERALTMDPTHREARQNLRFLKRSGGILQFEAREFDSLLASFRKDNLLRIATLAAWLALLGLATTLSLQLGRTLKMTLLICSPILALIAIAAAVGIYLKHQRQEDLAARAVVTGTAPKAYTAPARAAGTVIDLPPGSQIARVSQRGDWDYIDVPGDLRGWVPADAITTLWPYDPALAD
jgi:tetratricopeptide (TPR) repeat protein